MLEMPPFVIKDIYSNLSLAMPREKVSISKHLIVD